MPQKPPLRVGLAGLGAVGLEVGRRLEAGIPGLLLAAVAVRDVDKACRAIPRIGAAIDVRSPERLAEVCDVLVECLPLPCSAPWPPPRSSAGASSCR